MTRIIITGCVLAASLLLAACETTDTTSHRQPTPTEQNPARQMHYPSSGY